MDCEPLLPDFNDFDEEQDCESFLTEPFQKAIEKHFENLNFKHYDIEINKDDHVIQITIQLEQYISLLMRFAMKFLVLCTTIIDYQRKRIECKSYIAKPDGQIIQVKEKYLQRLLCRYFCRLNSSLRFGCFCLEIDTGQLMLKLNSLMIPEHWADVSKMDVNDATKLSAQSAENLSQLLKALHFTSHYAVGFHIYRLMYLINKLSYKVFPYLEQKLQNQYRKFQDKFDQHLIKMNEIIQNKCTQEITPNEIEQYRGYFVFPKPPNIDHKIINKIYLGDNEQIQKYEGNENIIGEGGFSKVYKTELNFSLKKDSLPTKRTIVAKVDKKKNELDKDKEKDSFGKNRIIHEKEILAILSQVLDDPDKTLEKYYKNYTGICPFIAQFYMTEQLNYEKILFMEFYSHTSLDTFRAKFTQTQSLNTKLYILYQIATGLRYMAQYGVVHMDLKPGNILISKNYIVKITDFGEAICINQQTKLMGGQGRTLPFAAPESLTRDSEDGKQMDDKNILDNKCDIFSFGILMYEYLFDQYPIDFKKSNVANLQERYKNKAYQVRSNIDFIKTLGPKHLMKCLRNLAIKCLEKEGKDRPQLEWIVICLREGLQYIEKMY